MSTALRLLDFNVFAHHIENLVEQVRPICRTEKMYQGWIKACWSVLINRAPDAIDNQPVFTVIASDQKVDGCYWRHHYLRAWLTAHFPDVDREKHDYKGGRKEKTTSFDNVWSVGQSYAFDSGIPFISIPGFEADDIIAFFVKERMALESVGEKTPPILIHTIDCDLMQLVGPQVTWVNSGPWAPRVRDMVSSLEYLNKKGKIKVGTKKKLGLKDGLTHPEQIVDTKVIEGDKSDNLFAGMAPRQVIDLLNPPTEFDLSYSTHRQWLLSFMVEQNKDNRDVAKFKKAREFLFTHGLPCPFSYGEKKVGQ